MLHVCIKSGAAGNLLPEGAHETKETLPSREQSAASIAEGRVKAAADGQFSGKSEQQACMIDNTAWVGTAGAALCSADMQPEWYL